MKLNLKIIHKFLKREEEFKKMKLLNFNTRKLKKMKFSITVGLQLIHFGDNPQKPKMGRGRLKKLK